MCLYSAPGTVYNCDSVTLISSLVIIITIIFDGVGDIVVDMPNFLGLSNAPFSSMPVLGMDKMKLRTKYTFSSFIHFGYTVEDMPNFLGVT